MVSEEVFLSPLGKKVTYVSQYDSSLLCAIPRENTWKKYGYKKSPYIGCDIWNAYELSWLNKNGLPIVVVAEIRIPLKSTNLIESKSFKLYLNSFTQTRFNNVEEVSDLLETDLSACASEPVSVKFSPVSDKNYSIENFKGFCLDHLDVSIEKYSRDASLLQVIEGSVTNVKLYSHLLKTNCPLTKQPD